MNLLCKLSSQILDENTQYLPNPCSFCCLHKLASKDTHSSCCFNVSATCAITPAPSQCNHSCFTCKFSDPTNQNPLRQSLYESYLRLPTKLIVVIITFIMICLNMSQARDQRGGASTTQDSAPTLHSKEPYMYGIVCQEWPQCRMEAHIHFSPTHLLQASYHFFCKNHKKKHQQGDKSLVPPNSKLLLSLE